MSTSNDGISIWDGVKYVWELWAKAAAWVWKWVVDLVDLWWDVAAFGTDLVTNAAADLTWKENIKTSLSANKWILDKAWDHLNKWFDQIWDQFRTKIWETGAWKFWVDAAWFIWELFAPAWTINKWTKVVAKWVEWTKMLIGELKKIPWAFEEVKKLMSSGKKANDPEVMQLISKYVPTERFQRIQDYLIWKADDVIDFQWLPKNLSWDQLSVMQNAAENLKNWKLATEVDWFSQLPQDVQRYILKENGAISSVAWKADKATSSFIKWGKTPEEFKAGRAARMEESSTDNMFDFPKWKTAEEFTAWRAKSLQDIENASEEVLTDPESLNAIEKWKSILSRYSPQALKELLDKYPKLKTWSKLALAIWLNHVAEISNEDAPIDSGITLPKADTKVETKDMPVNTPDMSRSEEEPTTVADKKKELELLKEKNAWSLNMSTSVVDLMKGLGVDSKREARKIIFEKMTGKPYTASAEDNIQLKQLIEEAFSKGILPDLFQSIKR